MKIFSILMITITFIIGVIIVFPSPAGSPVKSTFVKQSIRELKVEYQRKQAACNTDACYQEWQAKLDILNEETDNESE